MIIVVTGSRNYKNPERIKEALTTVHSKHGIEILFSGHCGQGADYFAEEWAKAVGVQMALFPAPWNSNRGILSGFDRNGLMLDAAMDLAKPNRPRLLAFTSRCVLFPPKCNRPGKHVSHGTWDCILKARDLPIRIRQYEDETLI